MDEPWTAPELRELIVRTARAFVDGTSTVRQMRDAMFQDLATLCEAAPLDDDLIELFDALDKWDSSRDAKRAQVEAEALTSARKLVESLPADRA